MADDLVTVLNSVVTDLFGGALVGSMVEWGRANLVGYGGYSSRKALGMKTMELVGLLSADVVLSQMYFQWTRQRGLTTGGSVRDMIYLMSLMGAQPDMIPMIGEWTAAMRGMLEGNPMVSSVSHDSADADVLSRHQDTEISTRHSVRDPYAETFERPYGGR